jgi:hypothetical protein
MFRYWKALTTGARMTVNYTQTELEHLYAITLGLKILDFPRRPSFDDFKKSVANDMGIDAGQGAGVALVSAGAVVDVTGHSLGGHLAMLFSRFFGGQCKRGSSAGSGTAGTPFRHQLDVSAFRNRFPAVGQLIDRAGRAWHSH